MLKYDEDGMFEYALAPNGERSLLSEKQWIQVRTKFFRDWFGHWEQKEMKKSCLLDQNSEPQVFYHGTTRSFSEFSHNAPKTFDLKNVNSFFFFTSSEAFAYNEYGKFKINLIVTLMRRFNEVFFDAKCTSWSMLVDIWNEFVKSLGTDRVVLDKKVDNGEGGYRKWTVVEFDGEILCPTDEFEKLFDMDIPVQYEENQFTNFLYGGKHDLLIPLHAEPKIMPVFLKATNPFFTSFNSHNIRSMDDAFDRRNKYSDTTVAVSDNGVSVVGITSPLQIKSSTDNIGFFDPKSCNIFQ